MGHPEVTFSQKILISHGRHYKGNKANGLTVAELHKKYNFYLYIKIYIQVNTNIFLLLETNFNSFIQGWENIKKKE